jgi:EmrB/QacA subfamily drug resistance transporter
VSSASNANGGPGQRSRAGGPAVECSNPTIVLVLVCAAQFMVILDVSVVNVALPAIRRSLRFSQQDLQWVVSAYTLTFAGFLLLGGRAADLLGRRRVFVAGLVLFTGASLLGGLATSRGMLIGARAIQGLGGAVVSPATLAILTTTFREGAARNRAIGWWGAMAAAGGSFGVLLGGILTDALSWRWILFINVPIGLAAIVLSRRFVPESRDETMGRHYDVAGALTITLGLVAIVYAIVSTDTNGWGSAQTLGTLALGLALVGAFVAIEARFAAAPLVPLRIFSSRMLTGANLVMLAIGAASFAMWFFISLYLQQVLGYSPIQAGLAFLPITIILAIGAQLASRLITRIGMRPLLTTGLLLLATGLVLFSRVSARGSYLGDVLAPSLVVGAGMGLSFVPATVAAVAGVAPGEAGLASGLVNTSRQLGGALGLAILATVATSRTNNLLHSHAPAPASLQAALTSGYQLAFLVAAAFALVGSLTAWAMLGGRRTPSAGEQVGERVELEPAPAAAAAEAAG